MIDTVDDPQGPGDAAAALAKLRAGQSAQPVPSPPMDAAAALAKLRAGSAAPSLDLNAAMQPDRHDYHAEYKSGALANRMQAENDAEKPASYGQQVAGGIAALDRRIPFAEAAQAGYRSLYRTVGSKLGLSDPESYDEALSNIRQGEASNPIASGINSAAGATVAAAAMPGKVGGTGIVSNVARRFTTPTAQAAIFGAAEGMGQADQNVDLQGRAKAAAIGAGTGAVVGKVMDAGSNLVRAKMTPNLATQSLDREAATKAADKINYGAADAEGQAVGGTTPALQTALEHPRVQELADKFRASDRGQGASDAEVARGTLKLLSRKQTALTQQMAAKEGGYDDDIFLQLENIKNAKKMLRTAAASPSMKPAITMDVPAGVHETDPTITPGREGLDGPPMPGPVSTYTTPPANKSLAQGIRDFPNRMDAPAMQGPGGPAFRMPQVAEQVKPGIRVETPSMRIETAPAENVPAAMPSLPNADAQHAAMMGQERAMARGSQAVKTLMRPTQGAEKGLRTKTTESFLRKDVPAMNPAQADASLNGVLGRTQDYIGASANPIKLFGAAPSLYNASKVSPLIQALEQRQDGGNVPLFKLLEQAKSGTPTGVSLTRALTAGSGHTNP